MNRFRLALAFLTVLPARVGEPQPPDELGRSAGWFPLAGALIGALAAAAFAVFQCVFPPLLAAALSTAVWVGLTGGLHLDGLADCADGLLNASTPARRLEIMKDPRLGAFGGIGLTLAILLKTACLASLPQASLWIALPLAAATGRWLLLPAVRQPQARPGGLGAAFSSGMGRNTLLPAALTMGLLTALSGWQGLLAVMAAHAAAGLVFRLARARLGGMTGDVFGLLVELAELVVLAGLCARV